MASLKEVLQSSRSFVRALKSSTDPPHENGPTKIQIARSGWDSHSLNIPRKAGLILEWIFTRFHKEKSRKGHENPLLDFTHWSLVADILADPDDTQIESLISRASVPSLVASFITLYPSIPITSRPHLFSPLLRSLNVLWPLAMQRAGLDPLAECLWPSLAITDQLPNEIVNDGLAEILTLVLTGFHAAFENANPAGKKKTYTAISQHQFLPWLRSLHVIASTHPLHNDLYCTGIEILYNPDSLRTTLEGNPNSKTSSDLFSTLFGPSTSSDPTSRSSLLSIIPSLYRSYILALRKHRTAIFPGTASGQQTRERIRRAALRFGDECLMFLKDMTEVEVQVSVWKTTADVLRVIEEDTILEDSHTVRLRQVGEDALKVLDHAWDEAQSPLATYALDTLSCLHRIEPELDVQSLPHILERLATASSALNRPALTFLSQLTSYHSKTRTLHTLISNLLSAFKSSFPFLPFYDPKNTYDICTHSPLLSLAYADEVTNALRTFVTPGQADEVVRSVQEELEGSLPIYDASQEPVTKRRKTSPKDDERTSLAGENRDKSLDIIKFALVARLGTTALGAVLHNSTSNDAVERKTTCLARMDAFISGALTSAFRPEGDDSKAISKSGGKRSRSANLHESSWIRECLCSTILRLWYQLFIESGLSRSSIESVATWNVPTTLDRLNDTFTNCMRKDILPELHLEIGRALFARMESLGTGPQQSPLTGWPAFDTILDYVEANLLVNVIGLTYSRPHGYSPYRTKQHSALALWSLALERHLATIDWHASPAQLNRLVDMMIRVRPNSSAIGRHELSSGASVLTRAFTSASFWEFGNVRTAMLSVLDKQTSVFESTDTVNWLSAVTNKDAKTLQVLTESSKASLADIEAGVEVFRLLHYFPPEYLSRASKVDLASKALKADTLVGAFNPREFEWRTMLRSFVVLVAKQTPMKLVDEMASSDSWMSYLTLSTYGPARPAETYTHATLDLLLLLQMSATRAAIKTEGALLVNVLTHFLQCNPYLVGRISSDPLAQWSLLRFLSMLVRDFNLSSFPNSVLELLQQLCSALEEALRSQICLMVGQTEVTDFLASESIIEGWQILLSLRHWLSIESSIETYGQTLLDRTARIINSESSEVQLVSPKFRAIVLSLLVEQGQLLPGSDCSHVTSIAAAYILFTSSTPQAESACDVAVARASKSFSVAQYESALELIAEALQNGPDSQPHFMSLLHLSSVFLREAPERTSKLSYEHASQCLRIFINRPAFANCSSRLAGQVLNFVQFQCTERAASLKAVDVTCMLSMLSKLLVGCSTHDRITSPSIFQTIVYIVNALVRSRRDLLSPHLPQLSMVLRRLVYAIRGVRPLLGTKQHRIVADSLPRWINPIDPLGETEALCLARLLTAIATKSLVRTHGNDKQKAESLTRPFARHAPYVLLAYLQLMNDPLSILSATMRHELEPGLFALCTMMGEHGRDTLMVQSLDIGGKALLKSLWKEYDRQRYIGRG